MEHDYLISLLVIVGIDLILGGDNAVVIAMVSRHLPDKQRQQAIILGTFIAVVMRIGLTSAAVYLLNIPFLQCAGGIFLLYLGYQLLIEKKTRNTLKAAPPCGERYERLCLQISLCRWTTSSQLREHHTVSFLSLL